MVYILKLTLFSKIGYKLMVLIIAISYVFCPYVSPSSDDPIKTGEDTGAELTVAVWADSQISNYIVERTKFFDAACEDITYNVDGKVDSVLIAGDIAENGLQCEYQYIADKLVSARTNSFVNAVGNHDVRLKLSYKNTVKNFCDFTNTLNSNVGSEFTVDSLKYSYEINGYKFIVLGTDRTEFEESYFTEEQLSWLDSELSDATKEGKPAFVICHQPLKYTHGLPDTWNSPIDSAGSIGKQSDEVKEILNSYNNVFFITGHLHTGIGQYTYEKIGNFHSINLPSLTIDNKDGECNENGIGFIMEAYSDHVLFRARNFAKGTYLPDYDIDIKLSSIDATINDWEDGEVFYGDVTD